MKNIFKKHTHMEIPKDATLILIVGARISEDDVPRVKAGGIIEIPSGVSVIVYKDKEIIFTHAGDN